MKRVASLDGLRALSISKVLLTHLLMGADPRSPLQSVLLAIFRTGATGVSLSFVISGFLITLLLLREKKANEHISLSAFYVRRIFRILPAFLLYVATIAALAKTGLIPSPPSALQFWHALTFTMDYVGAGSWYLDHLWSLSVEEQFYLIWPVLAVLCSRKSLIRIAIAVIVLEPFVRCVDYLLLPSTRPIIIFMGHTRADMLMFGCVVALLYEDARFIDAAEFVFRKHGPAIAAIFLFLISPLLEWKLRGLYRLTVGYTLQGASIAVLMLFAIRRPGGRLGQILNAPVVVWIGVLSYSVYLWQQLFLMGPTFTTQRSCIGLIFVFPAAAFSYYLVERPVLRAKNRLMAYRTRGLTAVG